MNHKTLSCTQKEAVTIDAFGCSALPSPTAIRRIPFIPSCPCNSMALPVLLPHTAQKTFGLQLPKQLPPLGRPLFSQSCRSRTLQASAVVCGVAIPMPTGFAVDSPPQIRRSAPAAGSNAPTMAEKLQRTLSGKTSGTTDGVIQVLHCFIWFTVLL